MKRPAACLLLALGVHAAAVSLSVGDPLRLSGLSVQTLTPLVAYTPAPAAPAAPAGWRAVLHRLFQPPAPPEVRPGTQHAHAPLRYERKFGDLRSDPRARLPKGVTVRTVQLTFKVGAVHALNCPGALPDQVTFTLQDLTLNIADALGTTRSVNPGGVTFTGGRDGTRYAVQDGHLSLSFGGVDALLDRVTTGQVNVLTLTGSASAHDAALSGCTLRIDLGQADLRVGL